MIHPTAIIYPNVEIEGDVYIGAYSVIGGPPEHKNYLGQPGLGVSIGANTYITAHVTIDSGTTRRTTIGKNALIFQHSHIGHDAIIEDNVIMANAIIGGHAHVMRSANLGLGAAIHQWKVIGSFCMIGMNAAVTKSSNCIPGGTFAGAPAKFLKPNEFALRKFNVTSNTLLSEVKRFEALTMSNKA